MAEVLQQQQQQPPEPEPAVCAPRTDPMSAEAPKGQPELAAVLQQFPPVAHAFAYGSGVFRQPGLYPLGSGDRPMLDFIFAVDAPAQWHAQVRKQTHAVCWCAAARLCLPTAVSKG